MNPKCSAFFCGRKMFGKNGMHYNDLLKLGLDEAFFCGRAKNNGAWEKYCWVNFLFLNGRLP